ncbi:MULTISPECIES: cell wall hydrolase [unclassified Caulobacter]|uniref:cell wall hydrolase n=1 Tax=unclassified Caulobacter TaxID=2648921 RepID=UPI0006F43693|nr:MULTISPECIES: cell wall hydrolase [unclassified Caulobacter]KQV56015.1 cell wall hydrolase [Caulobacter sp. Root342]KQV70811.1 cell wall hydrolase [Caulobacter sp. Root343]
MGTLTKNPAWKAAATVLAVGGLSACATHYVPAGAGREGGLMRITSTFSERGLRHYVADMNPAMLALARRHDPRPHKDYWGRVEGWEVINLKDIPRIGDRVPDFDEARIINALRPVVEDDLEPAKPFVLTGSADARARALNCLAQAVYYEAGFEPGEGQMAVAQTVLNRMRHPGYPKSICGVIYEGAARATGCQFSFACDGSLARVPVPALWANAQAVAKRALSGFVFKPVGTATHYHADYVAPYWAPTLVKLKQFGQHIFYRWTGPSGTLKAFTGRYSGNETVSAEILMAADPRTLEAAPPEVLAAQNAPAGAPIPTGAMAQMLGVSNLVLPDAKLVAVPDPNSPTGERYTAQGTVAGRRIPTADEIAKINKALEAVSEPPPAVVAAPAAPPPPPPKPKPRPPSLLNPLN